MSDYKKLDHDERMNGIGKPVRLNKAITITAMKAKINGSIDKAIGIMNRAMDDEKRSYQAAKDILAFYLQLSNMEMKEELHNEEMKFRRYKNKNNMFNEDKENAEDQLDSVGHTADIPDAKFSMEFDTLTGNA